MFESSHCPRSENKAQYQEENLHYTRKREDIPPTKILKIKHEIIIVDDLAIYTILHINGKRDYKLKNKEEIPLLSLL